VGIMEVVFNTGKIRKDLLPKINYIELPRKGFPTLKINNNLIGLNNFLKEIVENLKDKLNEMIIDNGNCIYVLRKPKLTEQQIDEFYRKMAEVVFEVES
jgi:hypothetical protein